MTSEIGSRPSARTAVTSRPVRTLAWSTRCPGTLVAIALVLVVMGLALGNWIS